jgi:hypothetical protein
MVSQWELELSEEEKKIFLLLLDVVRRHRPGTTLRVAGGWVRDKLLGKQPTDIDIALDDITGEKFCDKIDEYYQQSTGEKGQKGDTHVTMLSGAIRTNPSTWKPPRRHSSTEKSISLT